jgi:hypothetical protein
MPIHDWSRVRAGMFHHFYNSWIYKLSDRLLPEMPLFLDAGWYVHVPLEETYLQAWAGFPGPWKDMLENGD